MLNNDTVFEPENVNRTNFVEKREIDHSTLYSFNAPFQLLHADIANLEFLGKKCNIATICLSDSWLVFIESLHLTDEIKKTN